ncbi:radical SAM protein [Thermosipho melanesiensis]|uniref:Radical SAM domain protein n=2 Tax=Thermosipho melanesiensis TaxID=46541 RepID=A6LJ08_THEM4|nr:radical SAM protein [Thermosipho melanesiensis]ABR29909.1 Radical SAM domain protein [Thermosipho melanesiensis BI429]APT73117.1 radical SAM protein [Thermosipho melanesiensis]OOC38516.1 radical SAM protein [Thermosipho melanesiensis]OOC40320.1 radical SAM protein [Thermosipho melanesiensis]OOC40584.1 radical SAM protein [Thermosipho melanesiensis]
MEILKKVGKEEVAYVYLGKTSRGNLVEFVESIQPPIPREKKWVLIVSTLNGCPVGCLMCDAGGFYKGKLQSDEIMEQILFLVESRFINKRVPVEKFKIQFARMGEPALNEAVLDVLERLPKEIDAPGLMPSVSTVAPIGTDDFFERLLEIKDKMYLGRFQLQFSIHATDKDQRNRIIPIKKWSFEDIAKYGEKFVKSGDRKVTLNFALAKQNIADPDVIIKYFDKEKFLIKITPINPTYSAMKNNLESDIDLKTFIPVNHQYFVEKLMEAGYDVIISIGELEENKIGSNCGQYVQKHLMEKEQLEYGYDFVD